MTTWLWIVAMGTDARAAEHTLGLRYRQGWVPEAFLDPWFYDIEDAGALPFDRPAIGARAYGLEYTFDVRPDGGAAFLFWAERIPVLLDAGYWDDREAQAIHDDGDWIAPDDNLGVWALGVNLLHEIPFTSPDADVWAGFVFGMGLGVGVRTGGISYWHSGQNPAVLDPSCAPFANAPDRVDVCGPDGVLGLPPVAPILDITVGTRIHLTDHAMIRLEGGIHDVLYLGGAVGGTF